jgi:YD repeat-containing protein
MTLIVMRRFVAVFALLGLVSAVRAQYYYKDIVVTSQTRDNWKILRQNKVAEVTLQSIEGNGEPTPGFSCVQTISRDYTSISTYTKSAETPPSDLVAEYNASGQLKRTTDTSDTYQSTTAYDYDDQGRLVTLTNYSTETDNHIGSSEKHVWTYATTGIPVGMIKVKDSTDTTIVHFITDEKGHIVEERPEHNGQKMQVIYYYYSADGLLTDIVRYNEKAQRLLPDYIFEYIQDRVSTMLFVPAGSSAYQQWVYTYDEKGLKTNDLCYNKRKEIVGKIDYHYRFQ